MNACRARWATPRNPDRPTFGSAVAEVALRLAPAARLDGGHGFMPWQHDLADVAGEVDPDTGRFAYQVVVVIVPRQAGKTLAALATLIQRCSMARLQRGWYTAQTQKDAAQQFNLNWVPMIESSALAPYVKIRRTNGSEGFGLAKQRSRIGLFPPTEKALHGHQGDTVIVDEGWAFDLAQGIALETGIRPSQITRRHRQLWIISAGETEASTWLARYKALGRASVEAGDGAVCYFEFSAADDLDELDPYDRSLWWATHPALGHTIDESAIASDAATMDVAEFARSYLCVPTRRVAVEVIDRETWYRALDGSSEPEPPLTFGVDISFDRSAGAIGVTGRRSDGRLHVEVVDWQIGTGWMVPRILELAERYRPVAVALDPFGPARSLIEPLAEPLDLLDVELLQTTTADVATACADFYDDVVEDRLVHLGQGILAQAISDAGKRQIGDAWAWGRRTSVGDISPLVAVTLSRWALVSQPDAGPLVIY